jgi:hypothetical protein
MIAGSNGSPRLIVLWGIPGSGKSRFASHLADDHGFLFIDTDAGSGLDPVRSAWFSVIGRTNPIELFTDEVAAQPRPVVAEYGLWATADNIALLQRLERHGAEPWWFDGDRDACFAGWQEENRRRGRVLPDHLWRRVVSVIDQNKVALEALYGPARMLKTVDAGRTYRDVADLYSIVIAGA